MELAANPFDLTGRRAFVTGAASGIGARTALRLAAAGAEVVCADRDEAGARATAAAISATGRVAGAVGLDVADRTQVQDVIGGNPPFDILCNVAGILRHATIDALTEVDLDAVLAVNLKGALFCAQAVYEGMREAGRGSIVNTASAAIDAVGRGMGAYAMSKSALVSLTRSLAVEWAGDGIRVNAVAPGFVDTPMTMHSQRDESGAVDEAKRTAYLARMRAMTPLGMAGEPDDVALTAWFLASDASRFMTGQILRPNGGVVMPW